MTRRAGPSATAIGSPQEMRLRSEPARRDAALPQGAPRPWHGRGHRHRRRLVLRAPAAAPDHRVRALQHQQPHDAGWPRQPAARLYRPAESRSAARAAASRRSRPADRSMPALRRPACRRRRPVQRRSNSALPRNRRRRASAISSRQPTSGRAVPAAIPVICRRPGGCRGRRIE